MGQIYKITNSVNEKVYIGQTARSAKVRWYEHLYHGNGSERYNNHNYHLYNAMRHYGSDAFSIEVIEDCDDQELDDRERFWISYYNSSDKRFGYNLTPGGNNCHTLDYEEVYRLWDEGLSVGEISRRLNIAKSYMQKILASHDGYSAEESIRRGRSFYTKNFCIPVCKYDMDGNLVETFNSISDAAKNVNGQHGTISGCCKGTVNYAYGHQWRYANDPPPGKYVSKNKGYSRVVQYDLDWNKIREFQNIATASREVGVFASGISACCNGVQHTCGGYKWAYVPLEEGLT